MSEQFDRLKDEIVSWAGAPPTRSAAMARAAVIARLNEKRRPLGWWLAATVSSAVAVGIMAVFLLAPQWPASTARRAELEGASRRGGKPLVVYELRSGTKVYVALEAVSEGSRSAAINGQEGDV